MICNTDLGNICIIKLGFGVQTREFWDLESEVFAINLKLQMGKRERGVTSWRQLQWSWLIAQGIGERGKLFPITPTASYNPQFDNSGTSVQGGVVSGRAPASCFGGRDHPGERI